MTSLSSDPLLTIAKVLIIFIMGVLAFAGIIVLACIPGIFIFGTEVAPELASGELPLSGKAMIAVLLAAIAGLLYLGWRFFGAMLAIIKSVGEGDPFVPANADRLTAMAWIMLAINVAVLPVAGLGIYIMQTFGEEPGTVDAGVDFGGIVLILVLFILARVFRQGTAMRDDLEGTV